MPNIYLMFKLNSALILYLFSRSQNTMSISKLKTNKMWHFVNIYDISEFNTDIYFLMDTNNFMMSCFHYCLLTFTVENNWYISFIKFILCCFCT